MDPAVQGALVAAIFGAASLVVQAVLNEKKDRRAAAERAALRDLEVGERLAQRMSERAERRYVDRLAAVSAFIAESDRLLNAAGQDEAHLGDEGPPQVREDPSDIEPQFQSLRDMLSRLELLTGKASRDAANDLERATSKGYASWETVYWRAAREAKARLLAAAREDLANLEQP